MSDTYTPCPECGSDNVARERSLDGDTFCYDCDLRLPHEDWGHRQFIAELNNQAPCGPLCPPATRNSRSWTGTTTG